jgi:hypothetical protein
MRLLLAVEDVLAEVVCRRVIAYFLPAIEVSACIGLRGKGYLKERAQALNKAASGGPILIVFDLDTPSPCPFEVARAWVRGPRHRNLLIRAAVMETESWILADRAEIARALKVPVGKVPTNPDAVDDPKLCIVNLARKSSSSRIREDLVPSKGATSKVGPGYNPALQDFVERSWRPQRARDASDSLDRMIRRLQELAVA